MGFAGSGVAVCVVVLSHLLVSTQQWVSQLVSRTGWLFCWPAAAVENMPANVQ